MAKLMDNDAHERGAPNVCKPLAPVCTCAAAPHCARGAASRPIRRCSTAASPPSSPFSRKAAAREAPAAAREGAAPTARLALRGLAGGLTGKWPCVKAQAHQAESVGSLQMCRGDQPTMQQTQGGWCSSRLPPTHRSVDTTCAWYSSIRRAPSSMGSGESPNAASSAAMRRTPRGRRACG